MLSWMFLLCILTSFGLLSAGHKTRTLNHVWSSRPLKDNSLAAQIHNHQKDCSVITNYHKHKSIGLGSDLHLWTQVLCNSMQLGTTLLQYNETWIWNDYSLCQGVSHQQPLSCYFNLQLDCPASSPALRGQLKVTNEADKCPKFMHNTHSRLAFRAAAMEYLFSNVNPALVSEAEKAIVEVFGSDGIPEKMITLHLHAGSGHGDTDRQSEHYTALNTLISKYNLAHPHIFVATESADALKLLQAEIEKNDKKWRLHYHAPAFHAHKNSTDPHPVDHHVTHKIVTATDLRNAVSTHHTKSDVSATDYDYVPGSHTDNSTKRVSARHHTANHTASSHTAFQHAITPYNASLEDNALGSVGKHSLVSLLLALEAQYFVTTAGSSWSRLINDLRRSVVDGDCGGCTEFVEIGTGVASSANSTESAAKTAHEGDSSHNSPDHVNTHTVEGSHSHLNFSFDPIDRTEQFRALKGDNTGLRVLVVSVDDRPVTRDYLPLTAVLRHNYCKKHNYGFISFRSDATLFLKSVKERYPEHIKTDDTHFGPSKYGYSNFHPGLKQFRASSFGKVPALWYVHERYGALFDYIWFQDSDAAPNPSLDNRSVGDALARWSADKTSVVRGVANPRDADFLFFSNFPWRDDMPCAGTFLFRTNAHVEVVLREWWDYDLPQKNFADFMEQDAMWYSLDAPEDMKFEMNFRSTVTLLSEKQFPSKWYSIHDLWLAHVPNYDPNRNSYFRTMVQFIGKYKPESYKAAMEEINRDCELVTNILSIAELMETRHTKPYRSQYPRPYPEGRQDDNYHSVRTGKPPLPTDTSHFFDNYAMAFKPHRAIYLIRNGTKRAFPNMDTLVNMGYDLDMVLHYSTKDTESTVPDGPDLPSI